MNFLFAVAVLVVVLGVLIFVHELGHFLAAKWAGIHVHRFALGMGPPIPGLSFRRGGTEYAICWLPLGGYVKMATREEEVNTSVLEGATPEEPVPPDAVFEAKPVWKRMIVILAGVTMNALFAWVVSIGLAYAQGEQVTLVTRVGGVATDSLPPGAEALRELRPGDRIVHVNGTPVESWNDIVDRVANAPEDSIVIGLEDGRALTLRIHPDALGDRVRAAAAMEPYHRVVAQTLQPGSAAERAGLAPGDTLLTVNGDSISGRLQLIERIRASAGVPLEFGIARGGQRLTLTITPDSVREDGQVIGRLGVNLASVITEVSTRPYSLGGAIGAGTRTTLTYSTQIVRTVKGLLSARISSREVGGPILIGQMAAQSARLGVDVLLGFMAFVSVNLAVLNLLPIPVLDGGQFLFLLAEAVIRRPLSLRLRERLTMVGLVLIVLLMVLAFSNDIRRLLGL